MNLVSVLVANARSRPGQPALIAGDLVLPYSAVLDRLGTLAAFLAGIAGPENRIGLALADTPDHVLLHYAVAWIGATIVPIDHRWMVAEKRSVADAFACRRVVHEPGDAAFAEDPRGRTVPMGGIAPPPPIVEDPQAPIVLSLSSGTTGSPTGALVSHGQLYERFVSQWAGMRFNGGDRFFLGTPLYFGGGRSFAMSFLAAGGTVILAPPPMAPLDLIHAATHHSASVAFLVPTQIRRLIEAWHGRAGLALPTLRLLVSSGAATHPQERAEIRARLTPGLMDYYASSEGGGIAILPPEEQAGFPETVGRPAFRVEIDIVDEQDRPLGPGAVGRLRYRGPGVSSHLVDAAGAVLEAGPGGWFYPGDLACILPSGHVQLRGRAKDVIIRGGVNIYPAEIEAVLCRHPAILEAAIVGLPEPVLGEIVAAVIVLRPGEAPGDAALQAHVRESLAPYKAPQRIARVQALPRNVGGKVIRAGLPALFDGPSSGPIER